MQVSNNLDELQMPFVAISKPDFEFVVDNDRIRAEKLYNALESEVTHIKLVVAEVVLQTNHLADMQLYLDEQKPIIEAKELLMKDLNAKYKFYNPF